MQNVTKFTTNNYLMRNAQELVYLKSLKLKNVRCFRGPVELSFLNEQNKPSQWTIILGDNGCGKTTILRTIVGILPPPESFLERRPHTHTRYYPSFEMFGRKWSLIRQKGEKASEATLNIMLMIGSLKGKTDYLEQGLEYKEEHRNTQSDYRIPNSTYNTVLWPPIRCFAYGATRKMAGRSLSKEKFETSSDTLFDEDALLQNAEDFFLQVDYDAAKSKRNNQRNKIKELLLRILPDVKDITIVKSGRLHREVRLKTPFGQIKIEDLSLGYKTSLAWLVDFATKMIYHHPNSEDPFKEPAIVIIDEIDLHMHPKWQRTIIETLSKTFPNTQFIATAHSPLIVQAAIDSNIIVLKKIRDTVHVDNDPIQVRNWRVDQILTSDLFGLDSSRPLSLEKHLKRRRVLLRKQRLSAKEKTELDKLNRIVHDMPVGNTSQEVETMDFLQELTDRIEEVRSKSRT